jgi:GT2 family glycosyltransferase
MQPLVSIVIVTWNRKNGVINLLRSIQNNTYKDVEVIVVDNHSTDGTVKEIRSNFPWVKLIVMPDSSYGACEEFNIGFPNAIGKYIAVLDDDSMLPPNWIENAVKKFEGEPEDVAVLATKIVEPSGLSWPSKDKMNKEFYCGFFSGAGTIIRRSALKKTRGYPKEYFIFGNEDELAAQFLSKGYKIKYFPEVTTYHRFGSEYRKSSSRLAKKVFYYYMRNRLWTIWMHESRGRLVKKTIGHLYILLKSFKIWVCYNLCQGIN